MLSVTSADMCDANRIWQDKNGGSIFGDSVLTRLWGGLATFCSTDVAHIQTVFDHVIGFDEVYTSKQFVFSTREDLVVGGMRPVQVGQFNLIDLKYNNQILLLVGPCIC
jgi:hypothetical protein